MKSRFNANCLLAVFMVLSILTASKAFCQTLGTYGIPYETPALSDDASSIYLNPAGMAAQPGFEMILAQDFSKETATFDGGPDQTAVYMKFPPLGFAFLRQYQNGYNYNRWTIPLAFPVVDMHQFGLYAGGTFDIWNATTPNEDSFVDGSVGGQMRLFNFLALGITGSRLATPTLWDNPQKPQITSSGALSFFQRRITLSFDHYKWQNIDDTKFIAGVRVEPLWGISLSAFLDNDQNVSGGVSLDLAAIGAKGFFANIANLDSSEKKPASNTIAAFRVSEGRYRSIGEPSGEVIELVLDDSVFSESGYKFPLAEIFEKRGTSLFEITQGIRRAADDDVISGIYLTIKSNSLSMAEMEELRTELIKFKAKSQKPVYVYIDSADNKNYYLASMADYIYLNPAGQLIINGLSSSTTYFKGTLDAIGVTAVAVRAEEFKTAIEPFTTDKPSTAAVIATNALLDDFYEPFIKSIADGRGKTTKEIEDVINNLGILTPSEAIKNKLVDELVTVNEVKEKIEKRFDRHIVFADNYFKRVYRQYNISPSPTIAVIEIRGTIIEGESGTSLIFGDVIGDEEILKALKEAEENSSIKAVIIRVNSPGGSSIASDKILQAIVKVRKKKPVIVSMGTYAASGGYLVSLAGNPIYASPFTTTGSIGIFYLHFSASNLYTQKLKLTHSVFKRGEHSDFESSWHTPTELEMDRLNGVIYDFYNRFTASVGTHRDLSPTAVETIAKGRVWSGTTAKKIGLLNDLGGFADAVAEARKQADISDIMPVNLVFYPNRGFSMANVVTAAFASHYRSNYDSAMLMNEPGFLFSHALAEELTLFSDKPMYFEPQLPVVE